MLDRFLIVWLTMLSALAYFWPVLFPSLADPFVATKPVVPWLISVTMFSVGCLMRRDEFREVVRDWPAVCSGTVIQYVATPLLAWGFGHLCGLTGGHLIGVIIVGCVPGAMASNVLTMIAGGNVSYSVSLTTVSTIVSPVVVPVAMYACLRSAIPVDLKDVAIQLFLVVVGPVVLGRILCAFWPALEKVMERVAPILAPLTILWIIAGVVGANRDSLSQGVAPVVLALAGINLVGYLVGYWGGAALRFSEGVRRALTIEIGMQNAGLGVALAQQLFPDFPDAQVPPALFTVGSMLTATLLVQAWVWRDRRARRVESAG
ncbi:MAG: bile acid:sodium symporter family protein [Planctomycetes bacterium]|nr:bile acid:sodium symporter family protein [Planctomycetota bacterium]